jgi:hypothetical protein
MSNANLLFKSIDERDDAREKERCMIEAKEMARAERASRCSFKKHVNALYHPGRCEHPDRSKKNGIHSRLCLQSSCPLFQ